MAKINRYTQIRPAQYNPMSLEELMMVPGVKRQQHDELLNNVANTRTALAQADYMDIHGEKVSKVKERLEKELERQVNEVSNNGITGALRTDFVNLHGKYQQETGPKGTIGSAGNAKLKYGQNKDTYIANATKLGYSPEDAGANWEDHSAKYMEGQKNSKEIGEIEELYAPNYKNVVDEFTKLADKAKFSSEDIANITSNIVSRQDGSYVLNEKTRNALKDNGKNLEAVENWINGNLNNPNSELMRSIGHQRKTKEDALAEIQGLAGIYRNKEVVKDTAKQITGWSPNAKTDISSGGTQYMQDYVQGIQVDKLPAAGTPLEKYSNPEYGSYEDKARAILPPNTMLQKDPETGDLFYEEADSSGRGTSRRVTIPRPQGIPENELNELRNSSPVFKGMTDEEVINTVSEYRKSLNSNFVNVVARVGAEPDWLNNRLFGEKGGEGAGSLLHQKGVSLNGTQMTVDEVYKGLGYDNYKDMKELGKPSLQGYSSALGKYVATVLDKDGNSQTMFLEGDEKLNKLTPTTRHVGDLMMKGETFSNLGPATGFPGYTKYFINDYAGNPIIVYSQQKDVTDPNKLIKKVPTVSGTKWDVVNPGDKKTTYQATAEAEMEVLVDSPRYKELFPIPVKKTR